MKPQNAAGVRFLVAGWLLGVATGMLWLGGQGALGNLVAGAVLAGSGVAAALHRRGTGGPQPASSP